MSAAPKIQSDYVDLKKETYSLFAEHIYDLAGVSLPYSSKNDALVRNRLARMLKQYSVTTFEDYWKILKEGDFLVKEEFISAMTTNMTSFFREPAHFSWLKQHIVQHFSKLYSMRIWCAAASTGQEPYTIAITVCEALPEKTRAYVRILASDIDNEVLKKASLGYYRESEISGLTRDLIFKYFDKVPQSGETIYRVKDFLRDMIQFSNFNLMQENYEFKRPFDVIFCRNVLIYFDEKTVQKTLDKLALSLAPNGHLLLGHSESGNVKNEHLKPLSKAIFQRLGSANGKD